MPEQRRRAHRVPLSILVRYEGAEGPVEATAYNLSTLGLFIRTTTPLVEGSARAFTLQLSGGSLTLQGEIRRARGAPFEVAGMGVEFIFEDEATAAAAAQAIQEEMFESIAGAIFKSCQTTPSAVEDKSAPDDPP